jgi:hypothetical protein
MTAATDYMPMGIARHRFTGVYQCTRRVILQPYARGSTRGSEF